MDQEKYKFMHYRKYDRWGDLQSTGGFTVCVDSKSSNEFILYSIAICNEDEKDNFCKKEGRERSVKRMQDREFFALRSELTQLFSYREIFEAMVEKFDRLAFIKTDADKSMFRKVKEILNENY